MLQFFQAAKKKISQGIERFTTLLFGTEEERSARQNRLLKTFKLHGPTFYLSLFGKLFVWLGISLIGHSFVNCQYKNLILWGGVLTGLVSSLLRIFRFNRYLNYVGKEDSEINALSKKEDTDFVAGSEDALKFSPTLTWNYSEAYSAGLLAKELGDQELYEKVAVKLCTQRCTRPH